MSERRPFLSVKRHFKHVEGSSFDQNVCGVNAIENIPRK